MVLILSGHASLQVIDNESVTNFNEKCDRVVQAISTRLGLYEKKEVPPKSITKRKFLVRNYDPHMTFPFAYREFLVERNNYLNLDRYLFNASEDGTQTRIRRREELGTNAVHLNMTIRHAEVNGQKVETRRNVPNRY